MATTINKAFPDVCKGIPDIFKQLGATDFDTITRDMGL